MKKRQDLPPVITKFLDEEERELYEAIESGNNDFVSILTPERKAELHAGRRAIRSTMSASRSACASPSATSPSSKPAPCARGCRIRR